MIRFWMDWSETGGFLGKIAGRGIEPNCEAVWVLNHQFLRIHFIDSKAKRLLDAGDRQETAEYEAMVFIGYDNMSERYVVHWIDVFGGRFSETLGFGKLKGKDSVKFVFEGPDGPLHNTMCLNPANGTWSIVIEQKDRQGRWTTFAVETLHRISPSPSTIS